MKLVDNFYAYLWPGVTMAEMQRYGNNCNTYVIAHVLGDGKHVIIDPGQAVNEMRQNCLDRLVIEMDKDGIKVEDIGLIIPTHVHSDHYGAAEDIKKMSGAPIAIGELEWDFFQTAQKQMASIMQMMNMNLPKMNPDIFLKEGELNLGPDMVAQILITPGHSPGHLGIYLPGKKMYFGGDLIFYGSTGRVDIPGGDSRSLKNSIEKVAQLDLEYILTGHQYGSPGIIEGEAAIKKNFEFIKRNIYPYL